jgi:hypothetical protein
MEITREELREFSDSRLLSLRKTLVATIECGNGSDYVTKLLGRVVEEQHQRKQEREEREA